MKRPTMLVEAILRQASMDLDLSVERDIATLRRRCKHEGLSFLTITLPTLSDALERGLEAGLFSCPSSFASHGRLPRFLSGFFNRVFTKDGGLRHDACADVVYYIRQVCRFFKKLKIGCSVSRNRAAVRHFIDVEGELRHVTPLIERKDILLDKISGIIWSQVFPEIDYVDLICHHGPGYTADKLSPNGRQRIRKWNQRSEFRFPSDLHCYPNYGVSASVSGLGESQGLESVKYLSLKDEESVRVVFVPKTQTTPRVIAIEPSHMQFMQQSVKDYVYRILEAHALTKHSIRFTRQDVNQKLARSGSIDKRTTTLDLKDASDRVHLHLVQRIFKTSGLLEYLEDARSIHATLPNGYNMVLFKYASMGSALCFPVESMVFYTLIQVAMHQLDGRRPSSRSIREYSKSIDIYGDDIIVPTEYADVVVRYLESYALKVNVSKSFKEGNFRESCGADFFKGEPVNPVYARQIPFDNARSWGPEHVMSWVATADLFYIRGKWIVAQAIRDMVRHIVRRSIPKTRELGSGVAFFSLLFTTNLRWNRDLQCWQQKRLHYDPTIKKDSIDGDEIACLNKWGYASVAQESFSGSRASSSFGYRDPHWGISRVPGSDNHEFRGDIGHNDPHWGTVSAFVGDGIPGVQRLDDIDETFVSSVQPVVVSGSAVPASAEYGCAEELDSQDQAHCLIERVSNPLDYLIGSPSGLDFSASTKRGSFKSKCRWVSLQS